jgi:YVTN family beta-propeller protein
VLALLKVGGTPVSLALKPDGGEVFVCNYNAHTISAINTATNEVSESFLAGDDPADAVVSADNSLLYVSNMASDTVAVFDITTRKMLVSVRVGDGPDALALSPGETMLFVGDSGSGDTAVLRLDKRMDKKVTGPNPRLFTMIATGAQPRSVVIKGMEPQQAQQH